MSDLKRQFTAAAAFIGAVENSGKRVRVDELRKAIDAQDAEQLSDAVRLLLPYTVELSWPTVWNLIEACKAVDAFAELKENMEYWRQRVYEQFPSSFQYYFEAAAVQQMKAKRLRALLEKLKYKPESNVFAGKAMPSAWYLLFQQCQRRLVQSKNRLAHLDIEDIGLTTNAPIVSIMSMTVVTDRVILSPSPIDQFALTPYMHYDGVRLARAGSHTEPRILHPAFGVITLETPDLSPNLPNFFAWLQGQFYHVKMAGASFATARERDLGSRTYRMRHIIPTQELFKTLPAEFNSLVHESTDEIGFANGALVNYTKGVFDIIASPIRRVRFAGVPRGQYIAAVLTSTPLVDLQYDSPFLALVRKNDQPYEVDLYNPNFQLKDYTCVNGWVSGTMPGRRHVVFNLYSYVKARDEGVAFQPFVVQKVGFNADVLLDLQDEFTVVHVNDNSIGLTGLQDHVKELIACHTCSQVAELQCPRCVTPYCSDICRQLDGSLHTLNCK